jgi:hypothetical protein
MPDAAGEWLRIAEHYRNMSDGELIVLARQKSALTAVAQQALRDEISNRRLIVPPEELAVPKPEPGKPTGSPYDEDRQLGEICTVWSLRDALQLQALLDRDGIPFFGKGHGRRCSDLELRQWHRRTSHANRVAVGGRGNAVLRARRRSNFEGRKRRTPRASGPLP